MIPSLPSPLHGASTSPHASNSGVEITQVLIQFEFEYAHYFICYCVLVAVSRSLSNVFFHLVQGQIPPPILLCWGYWDPYLERRGEILDTGSNGLPTWWKNVVHRETY